MIAKTKPYCIFCGASADQELEDAIKALLTCNNCRVDIFLHGQWTGDGWATILDLKEKHGEETLVKAYEAVYDRLENEDESNDNRATAKD